MCNVRVVPGGSESEKRKGRGSEQKEEDGEE